MEYWSTLDFIISGCFLIIHLLSGENQSLLLRGDPLLLLHTFLDPLYLIRRLDVDLDLFSSERLHFDKHFELVVREEVTWPADIYKYNGWCLSRGRWKEINTPIQLQSAFLIVSLTVLHLIDDNWPENHWKFDFDSYFLERSLTLDRW